MRHPLAPASFRRALPAPALLAVAFLAGPSGPSLAEGCNRYGPTAYCDPYLLYPPGQDLRLTVEGRGDAPTRPVARELRSIRDVFTALRSCWAPPEGELRRGMAVSVRVSFNRSGNVIGAPRLTYATPRVPEHVARAYREAAGAAVRRCTPLRLSPGLGGAIAGRPFMIRYIDLRSPNPGIST